MAQRKTKRTYPPQAYIGEFLNIADPEVEVPDHEPFTRKQREWLASLYSQYLVHVGDIGAKLDEFVETDEMTDEQATEIMKVFDDACDYLTKRLPMPKRMKSVGNES